MVYVNQPAQYNMIKTKRAKVLKLPVLLEILLLPWQLWILQIPLQPVSWPLVLSWLTYAAQVHDAHNDFSGYQPTHTEAL